MQLYFTYWYLCCFWSIKSVNTTLNWIEGAGRNKLKLKWKLRFKNEPKRQFSCLLIMVYPQHYYNDSDLGMPVFVPHNLCHLLLPRRRASLSGLMAHHTTWQTLWCHYCQPIRLTVLPFRGMPRAWDTFSLHSSVTSHYPLSASTRVNNFCSTSSQMNHFIKLNVTSFVEMINALNFLMLYCHHFLLTLTC